MSADDLNTFVAEFTRAMLDPTAPLPALWPSGALGVFLVFATQIGAGIPIGVILARDSGLSIVETAGLYLVSDVLLAVTFEPLFLLLRWMSRRVGWLGSLGGRMMRLSGATGLRSGRVRGPLGLILFSFAFAPQPARAVSEAAGHGPASGWTLAIIGDMLYFGVIMASTLLVIQIFGDSRMAVGPLVIGAWLLPMLVQRLRRDRDVEPARVVALPADGSVPARLPRKSVVSHNGRRRRATRAPR
jgi:hypothetical protein